jgi:hypothetical protein
LRCPLRAIDTRSHDLEPGRAFTADWRDEITLTEWASFEAALSPTDAQ